MIVYSGDLIRHFGVHSFRFQAVLMEIQTDFSSQNLFLAPANCPWLSPRSEDVIGLFKYVFIYLLLFVLFIPGMGIPLLLDVIRLVQPTHIIQFNYTGKEHSNKNLPKITLDFLMETPGWAFGVDEEQTHSNNDRLVKKGIVFVAKGACCTWSSLIYLIIYLLLTELEVRTVSYGPSFSG